MDIATLGLRVDATGAIQNTERLDRSLEALGGTSTRTEGALTRVTNESRRVGQESQRASAGATALAKSFEQAVAQATLAVERQNALNAAFGSSTQNIARVNAAFDLKAKLADIDAKFTGEQAEQLKALATELAKAEARSRNLAAATKESTKSVQGLGGAASSVSGIVGRLGAALGIAFGARQIIESADAYTAITARLKLATGSTAEFAQAQTRLFEIAQATRQSFGDVAQLYARLSIGAKDLGASQGELFRFVEGVNNALVVTGTTGAQASGALLQLSQAIGGGVVRAEEFNSILEGAPRILQAVAAGYGETGLSIAQLREKVIAGQVSSREFFDAFLKGSQQIKAEAATIPVTIGGALTQLNNAFGVVITGSREGQSATAALAQSISALASFMVDFADGIKAVTIALGVAGLVKVLGGVTLGFTSVAGAATAAWAAITGPIGLTVAGIGLVATGVYMLIKAFKDQKAPVDDAAASLETSAEAAKRLYEQAVKLASVTFVPPAMLANLRDLGGQLKAVQQGGQRLADATKLAAEEWTRSSGSAKSFAQAIAEGDAKAKSYLQTAQAQVALSGQIERTLNAQAKAQEEAAKALADRAQMEKDYQAQVVQIGIELAERAIAAEAARVKALQDGAAATAALLVSGAKRLETLRNEVAALKAGSLAAIEYANAQQLQALVSERLNEARAAGVALTPQVVGAIVAEAGEAQRLLRLREALAQWDGSNPFKIEPERVQEFGGALERVADTARDIAQIFGNVGTQITKGIQLAVQLAGAYRTAANAAKEAADAARRDGANSPAAQTAARASRGASLAAGASFLTASVSVITTWTNAVRAAGEEARRLANALRDAQLAAQKQAQTFARDVNASPLQRELDSITDRFNTVIRDLIAAGAPSVPRLGGRTARSVVPTADDVNAVIDAYEALIAKAKEAAAFQLAQAEGDLRARLAVAQGRADEAEAIRLQLAQQKELREAEAQFGADSPYIQHLKDVQAAEAEVARVAQAERARRTREDFDLRALAVLNPAGATSASFYADQAREMLDAIASGLDEGTIEALRFAQALEAAAFEIAKVEEGLRIFEGLFERGLRATGQGARADQFGFDARQRQEFADAVASGMSESNLALLQFIQFAEREQFLLQQAIAEQTGAIREAADKQIAALDEQITAIRSLAATQVRGLREQIDTIRGTAAVQAAAFRAQIEAIRTAAKAQTDGIDAQIEAARSVQESQRAALQVAQKQLGELQKAADALTKLRDDLTTGEFSPLSPEAQLREQRTRFETLAAAAAGGDASAAAALPTVAQDLLRASREFFASSPGFVEDFNRVQDVVTTLANRFAGEADAQQRIVTAAERTLAATERTIDGLQQAKDAIERSAQAEIAVIQSAADLAAEQAGRQIETLEKQIDLIESQAERDIEALETLKTTILETAEAQIQAITQQLTLQTEANIAAHAYYQTWQDLSTSAWADQYEQAEAAKAAAMETVTELRKANETLRTGMAKLADELERNRNVAVAASQEESAQLRQANSTLAAIAGSARLTALAPTNRPVIVQPA